MGARSLLTLGVLSISITSCGGNPTVSPTPVPVPVPTSGQTLPPANGIYTLFGVVSEMTPDGPVPVVGVRINETSCPSGPCPAPTTLSATTDDNGYYSIPGLFPGGNNIIWVTKAGYEPAVPPNDDCGGCTQVLTISGDTRFDIPLVQTTGGNGAENHRAGFRIANGRR